MNEPEPPMLHAGFWCECWTQSPATGEGPALLTSFRALTAPRAVRWMRIALRTLTSGLDAEAAGHAWNWIGVGYLNDIETLMREQPCAMTISHGDTHIGWTARPALFLPMAHPQTAQLPACATQFTLEPRAEPGPTE